MVIGEVEEIKMEEPENAIKNLKNRNKLGYVETSSKMLK